MNQTQDLNAIARTIIDSNLYLVLGTADESGRPWTTPVYYASADYRAFYWVSNPESRHSQNLAVRPQLSIVIFDSQAPIGTGQAVYMEAVGEALPEAELAQALDHYSNTALARGGRKYLREEVLPPADLRLYRATASAHWVIDPANPDQRARVNP